MRILAGALFSLVTFAASAQAQDWPARLKSWGIVSGGMNQSG